MKSLELVRVTQATEEYRPAEALAPVVIRILDVPEASDSSTVRVALPDGSEPMARLTSTVASRAPESLLGREALAVFEGNDPTRPILVDLLDGPAFADALEVDLDAEQDKDLDARVDGREVVIKAEQRLELRCGKASIIIDADGKISIKGAHLYNRATGPIRIKGGHVDIN